MAKAVDADKSNNNNLLRDKTTGTKNWHFQFWPECVVGCCYLCDDLLVEQEFRIGTQYTNVESSWFSSSPHFHCRTKLSRLAHAAKITTKTNKHKTDGSHVIKRGAVVDATVMFHMKHTNAMSVIPTNGILQQTRNADFNNFSRLPIIGSHTRYHFHSLLLCAIGLTIQLYFSKNADIIW